MTIQPTAKTGILICILTGLGGAGSALAQDENPEVGHTEAVVLSEEVLPEQPGTGEGPARGRSTLPADPSAYLPMPLPRGEEAEGEKTAPESTRAISFDLETRTEAIGRSEAEALLERAAVSHTLGSRGEGEWNWQALYGDDEELGAKNFGSLSFVGNPEDYPWRVAVKVFMSFRDTGGVLRYYVCSGSLIDSMHVITAGHCVYAHDDPDNGWVFNDWAESITVVPGYESGSAPYGDARAVQLHSWTGWTSSENFDDDIGVIDLNRPVGALTGWHGYGWYGSCGSFTGNTFRHAGYPAESPYSGAFLYTDSGTYDGCESILGIWYGNEVRYNRRSYGGQSGSGSYSPHNSCPSCWVRAVLSNGNSSHTDDVRLTEGKFNNIGGFIGSDTPGSRDLIPLDVNVSPGTIVVGHQLSAMNYLVHNYSSVSWSGTVQVKVYLSTNDIISTADTLIQSHSFTWSFTPKSSVRVFVTNPPTIPASASPGSRFIGVILDISDSNTANNDSSGQDAAAIQVNGVPDLVVNSVAVSSATLFTGQSFTVNATVRNQGNGSSSSTTLRYYRSTNSIISSLDTQIGTDFVSGLSAGSSSAESLAATAPASAGTYWIGGCVDTVTNESATGNNCSSGVAITVLSRPDLSVPMIAVHPTLTRSGEPLAVNATVMNLGPGSASSTTLRYYLSTNAIISPLDTEMGTDFVSALASGASSAESTTFSAPSTEGTYWIGACADGLSGELVTGNNCSAAVKIRVDNSLIFTDGFESGNLSGWSLSTP